MTRYKLYNTIRRDLEKRNAPIIKQRFSYSHVKKLFNDYEIIEFVSRHYCCYGEDFNCWIDEDVCWLPRWWNKWQLNATLYKSLKSIIHRIEKKYKRINVFYQDSGEYLLVTIPSRTVDKTDYYIVFKK